MGHRRAGRGTGVAAALAALLAVAVQFAPAIADPLVGPLPAGSNATMTLTSAVTNLANGAAVTFHVDTSGPTTLNLIEVHICSHATPPSPPFINGATAFGYSGAGGTRCVFQPNINSGGLTGGDYRVGPQPFSGVQTSGTITFHAGTGTVGWTNSNGFAPSAPLECDSSHECDMVVDAGLTSDPSGHTDAFFTQPLSYQSGPMTVPGQPTGLSATAGNQQAMLSWTAPASDGNSALTDYHVTVSPAPSSGPCMSGACNVGSAATNFTVPNLTNFTAYTFTVAAVNAIGTGTASSSAMATPGPPGPTGLAASAGDGQVGLTWTGVTGATNYQVNVSPDPASGPCSTGSCLTGSTTGAFTVPNLTNFTTYTFSVAAVVTGGTTAPSSSIMAEPKAAGPTGLAATPDFAAVDLTWNGITGASDYLVTVNPDATSGPCASGSCTVGSATASFSVPDLSGGTTYTFTVAGVFGANTGSPSTSVMARPKPAVPGGLAATAGDTKATLNWNSVVGATDYQVNVSPSPSGGPCTSGTCLVGGTGTTFMVTNLTNFTQYSFTIQAKNPSGLGEASNTATATPVPAGPTGLAAASRDAAVNLTWNTYSGATDYEITVSPSPTGGACASGTCNVGGPTATFTVPNLASGTTYSFTVAAVLPAGTTAPSASVNGSPNVAATATPSTVNAGSPTTINSMGWKASSTVTAMLESTPESLGSLTADGNGAINSQVTIPADAVAGSHTIVLTGTDPTGAARTINIGITVTPASSNPGSGSGSGAGTGTDVSGASTTSAGTGSSLPFTGANLRGFVSLALLLIAAGLALLSWRYRRQAVHA